MNNTTNTALEPFQFVKYTDTLAAELDTYVKYAIAEQLNTVQMSMQAATYIQALLSMEVTIKPMTFREMVETLKLVGNKVWLERATEDPDDPNCPREICLARVVGNGTPCYSVFKTDTEIEVHLAPEYGYSWRLWLFEPDEKTRRSIPWKPAPFGRA